MILTIQNHTINPLSFLSVGSILASWSITAGIPVSAVYPSANLAIYIPFRIQSPINIAQLFWYNGATATGNVDMGVYSKDGQRILSSGTTAQTGTNALQLVDITDVRIGAGMYWIALACDSGSSTFFSTTLGAVGLHTLAGIKQQASAFVLPTTATFADAAQDYFPLFGFTPRSVI